MKLPKHLVEEIFEGDAVLFLGAGASVSLGAPSAIDLASHLRTQFGVDDDSLSLRDLAQYIEHICDRPSLVNAIQQVIADKPPNLSDDYVRLLSPPWKAILTTNYDHYIEAALETVGRPYCTITVDEDVAYAESDKVCLYKLHGSLDRAASIVITDDDYIRFVNARELISRELRSLFARYTVFFIGYSLVDSNIREVTNFVTELLPRSKRRSYLASPGLSEALRVRIEHLGITPLDIALADVVQGLPQAISSKRESNSVGVDPAPFDAAYYAECIVRDFGTLESVFTMLRLQDVGFGQTSTRSLLPLVSLDRLVRGKKSAPAKSVTLADFERDGGRWLISGRPGSGKTTLLHMLALSTAQRILDGSSNVVPIVIDLGRYQGGLLADLTLTAESIGRTIRQRISPVPLPPFLDQQAVVWYLDSADEATIGMANSKRTLWDEVNHLVDRYPNHSFVISCRDTEVPVEHDFEELTVQDFGPDEALQFVDRYLTFFDSQKSAAEIFVAIPEPARPLANTPLLLSIMVSSYVYQGAIPDTVDELYRVFIRQVLDRIEVDRPGTAVPYVKDVSLAALAFEMLVSGHPVIRRASAAEVIARRIGQLVDRGEMTSRVGADVVLSELIYSGILIDEGSAIRFLHLTLLEYFAACEMNREYSFVARSEMDQYFLRNMEKIDAIMKAAHIGPTDRVLELGAGIGSVARHIPPCHELLLLELDSELARILRYQFPGATVLQADAVSTLPSLDATVILSNLPHYLTGQILKELEDMTFRVAIMSVPSGQSLSDFRESLEIDELLSLDEDDFFPRQPFKSKLIRVRPLVNT